MSRLLVRLLVLACFVIPTSRVIGQTAGSAIPDWEDPHVFGIGKEGPRANYTPYPTEAAATASEATSLVESLDGNWKFQ